MADETTIAIYICLVTNVAAALQAQTTAEAKRG
jgi:hypothetical protein